MLKEFKDFIMRGNVLDMAIGIILGVGFGKIVSSFVSDVMMPPLGMLMGRVDFSNLYLNLSGQSFTTLAEAKKAGAVTINYGLFLNSVIDFTLVAASIFVFVKIATRLKRKETVASPALTNQEKLLTEIRDLLRTEK